MKLIDLHIHTTVSDGTLTPEQTVAYAAKKGLAAIAVTDHDTADGAAEALLYAERYGVEVVPGIEISADYRGYGVHILGYFIDTTSPSLQKVLDWIVQDRKDRNHEMMALMRADGLNISPEIMKARFPDAVVGRPHFAAFLVGEGKAKTVQEAFTRFLNFGGPYFRRRKYLPLDIAFEAIHGAGGKAVFAHPLQYRMDDAALRTLAKTLKDEGAVGMECLYSGYTPAQRGYLMALAEELGLCVTGGSDFHGARKPQIDMGSGTGALRVPYELLETLRKK